jgi:hypothetical protein
MPFIIGVTGAKGYAGIGVSTNDEPEYKGTTMVFPQASAPVGWVQVTTHNDVGLRLTNAGGATNAYSPAPGTGGDNPFSSTYPATPAGLIFQDLHFTSLHLKILNYKLPLLPKLSSFQRYLMKALI